ncbi:hypothetical protein V8B97DRAFT_2000817 [Scleroderma yunnanense]
MAATLTRLTGRSGLLVAWPTISCRLYSTALVQQPKQKKGAPSKRTTESASQKKKANDADSVEEQLKALERMRRLPSVYTSTDIWGSPMASFDVQIPYDIRAMLRTFLSQRPYKMHRVRDIWFAIKHNTNNWLKNAFGMFTVAKANAFPGLTNIQLRIRPAVWRRLRGVQSHDSKSWLAPLRKIALETYRQANVAVARQNEEVLKALTVGEFQSKTLQVIRRREKGHKWFWDITSDTSDATFYVPDPTFMTRLCSCVSWLLRRKPSEPTPVVPPVTVVSIRAAEIYLAEQDPKVGHRLVIQALVKFDTTQVLKVTDRHGNPIKSELSKPHRVVQYIILEKIGWYDSPWKLKEQIYRK